MTSHFAIEKEITFAQTDMAGFMHFGEYFTMMEECEHRFFQSLGISITPGAGALIWPRKACSCEYFHPLRFQDQVLVELNVVRKSSRSITFEFEFKLKGEQPQLIARGQVTTVCCSENPKTGKLESTAIPRGVDDKLDVMFKDHPTR